MPRARRSSHSGLSSCRALIVRSLIQLPNVANEPRAVEIQRRVGSICGLASRFGIGTSPILMTVFTPSKPVSSRPP
jgi:hypothetical protein